ncbi:MAG: hypothetical protein IPO78_10125 [Saprospiraceae bacterium]|nr:hypothetical protein [Saprospiraceae bacterium]
MSDIEISEDIWADIEWIDARNFGALEFFDSEEELWRFGLANFVRYKGDSGILCVLTKWQNNGQVVKLLFISQDSSLEVVRFKTIKDNIEDFIAKYIDKRPAEPEKESFDDFWENLTTLLRLKLFIKLFTSILIAHS